MDQKDVLYALSVASFMKLAQEPDTQSWDPTGITQMTVGQAAPWAAGAYGAYRGGKALGGALPGASRFLASQVVPKVPVQVERGVLRRSGEFDPRLGAVQSPESRAARSDLTRGVVREFQAVKPLRHTYQTPDEFKDAMSEWRSRRAATEEARMNRLFEERNKADPLHPKSRQEWADVNTAFRQRAKDLAGEVKPNPTMSTLSNLTVKPVKWVGQQLQSLIGVPAVAQAGAQGAGNLPPAATGAAATATPGLGARLWQAGKNVARVGAKGGAAVAAPLAVLYGAQQLFGGTSGSPAQPAGLPRVKIKPSAASSATSTSATTGTTPEFTLKIGD